MEPNRFTYSPIVERPRIEWPNGGRLALWVVPNIEHYEYVPRDQNVKNPWPRCPAPDVLGYATKDYGNRVGVWRMFDVMDKHAVRCTVSLSISVIEHYPEIFEGCEARGWDTLCHGVYNTRYLFGLEEDEERAVIADCVDTYRSATGRQLPGWFGPAASFTLNSPDLIAEAGIKYCSDWYHDDQPCPIRVRNGRLITVPYTMDINDAIEYRHPTEGKEFARMIIDEFDTLYRESETSGRVMCIALHPYIMGQPHRIKHLDDALGYVLSHEGVWQATGEQIADWYYEHYFEQFQTHIGAEA